MARRIVVIVEDGLVGGVFVPRYDFPEVPVQVLNIDKGDPAGGARDKAYREAFQDQDLDSVDWTFLGTEDND